MRASGSYAVGTIAFVADEESLLVRVKIGWQYLSVRRIPFRDKNVYTLLITAGLCRSNFV